MSSKEEQLLRTPGNPLYCYYPESIYVADHIPTRKPRELESFKNHCHLQYDTYRLPLEINHPIENIVTDAYYFPYFSVFIQIYLVKI